MSDFVVPQSKRGWVPAFPLRIRDGSPLAGLQKGWNSTSEKANDAIAPYRQRVADTITNTGYRATKGFYEKNHNQAEDRREVINGAANTAYSLGNALQRNSNLPLAGARLGSLGKRLLVHSDQWREKEDATNFSHYMNKNRMMSALESPVRYLTNRIAP
jgi:hypothetical protein